VDYTAVVAFFVADERKTEQIMLFTWWEIYPLPVTSKGIRIGKFRIVPDNHIVPVNCTANCTACGIHTY